MEGKKSTGAATITEATVQAVLRRGGAATLTADEEKVLRMRLGAPLPSKKPLERVGQGMSDTEIELLAYEIEAYLKLRQRAEMRVNQPVTHRSTPSTSRVKEKIVRALRKKS